jgi:hypothetical protein
MSARRELIKEDWRNVGELPASLFPDVWSNDGTSGSA